MRPLASSLHRRRRPTPLRMSIRPRGAEASTIWSTICANRSHQEGSHLPNYSAPIKMGPRHLLQNSSVTCVQIRMYKTALIVEHNAR
jgi:hypothetical protein